MISGKLTATKNVIFTNDIASGVYVLQLEGTFKNHTK